MRLPVILVQNPPASGASLAESLVGNLIGRAGLDLTLVDRFDSLAADSTDRMTLEGITVPAAILDWRAEAEIMQVLAAIGFHGIRCPHQLDRVEPSPVNGASNRRLFLFDLNRHRDANKIVAELDRLRQSLSVKTIGLGSIAGNFNSAIRPVAVPVPVNQTTDVATPFDTQPDVQALARKPAAVQGPRSDQNLDALIDQLDGLDV